ncbi:MAG TPA: hypothetical protein VMT02_02305 [Burkholderiales bacterium]|jgi:hypothetical protein|nr:hypothetical protein [Burkholderiales bacterium]
MSTEATVIAVAAAIYLADCVVLLERGQALWSSAGLAFGSLHYQLHGKAVAWLNPLTPFVAAFRTLPLFSTAPGAKPADAVNALAPLSVLCLIQLLLVLAVLPYCLLRAPGWPFFAALALAYANALALLGLLWQRLRGAGIATRPLAGLGFGWLVCLPLSVNALRKAALAFDVAIDAREAIGLLPERDRERARLALAAQIAEAMADLDEEDQLRDRLAALRSELVTPREL